MCGIAGLVAGRNGLTRSEVVQLSAMLRHRGPDDEGFLTWSERELGLWGGLDTDRQLQLATLTDEAARDARLALVHRRLSILDVSPAGHQPMASHDGRFWIAFNGEIYNFIELAAQLRARGHAFATGSDTEVLLAAYEEWGTECLRRLRGMFAFVIFDRQARSLFAARDPFGIKPLYYTRRADGGFAFASELKALLALSGVDRRANAPAIFEFVRFGVSDAGGDTMFAAIMQLPAAHFLTVSLDSGVVSAPKGYWRLPERAPDLMVMGEAAEALRAAFDESVRLHMRSDVPVGSCLSGGLDSTAIVAECSALMAEGRAFSTVSFISDDTVMSEAEYVDLAERTYPICSHRVHIGSADLVDDLDALIRSQDLPFGSLSIYAQFAVFRAARAAGLTVMLDGQGSDELFGGYSTAVSAAIAQRIARGELLRAARLGRSFSPLGARAYGRTILATLGRFAPPAVAPALMRAVGEPLVPSWMQAPWFAARGTQLTVRPQGRGAEALDRELRLFTERLSLPQLLRYEDRNSMASSIESRVPFCDIGVAEVAARIPTDLLVTDDARTKAVFRESVRGLVPDAIIDRPKIGFVAPDQKWMHVASDVLGEVITAEAPRVPFLDGDAFIAEFRAASVRDGYFPTILWRVVSTVLWARAFDVQFT